MGPDPNQETFVQHSQIIIDSTQEIFSTMIMLEVTPGEAFNRGDQMLTNSISGLVGLAGSIKGMVAVHLPNPAAKAVTKAFLGIEVEKIDDDVRDAIGELANMLAGSIKSALDPKGSDIKLSMPSAVYGEEYSVDCLAKAKRFTVPFGLGEDTFLVELQLRQDD